MIQEGSEASTDEATKLVIHFIKVAMPGEFLRSMRG
jgi:hypothetical protein